MKISETPPANDFEFDDKAALQAIFRDCAMLQALVSDVRAIVQNEHYRVRWDQTTRTIIGKLGEPASSVMYTAFLNLMAFVDVPVAIDFLTQAALDEQETKYNHDMHVKDNVIENWRMQWEEQRKRGDNLQKRVIDARSGLLTMLDSIMQQDVTHAERRGQLKFFYDRLHKELQAALFPTDEIPF